MGRFSAYALTTLFLRERVIMGYDISEFVRGNRQPGLPDAEDEDSGLDLPVNPDESIPLIPDDDERVVNVPS